MLAFVFWHWPEPTVAPADYERRLADFHRELARASLPGFKSSAAFWVEGAPWVGPEGRGYEDWYLVSDFAALDPLNEGAVSAERRPVHQAIAAGMAGGAGAIYGLQQGAEDVAGVPTAAWISKPRGMSYADFYGRIQPLLHSAAGAGCPGAADVGHAAESTEGTEAGLWRRQLVLGPAPEFCLLSAGPLELPAPLTARVIQRTPVWG